MLPRRNLDPYATIEVADPLEGLRIRLTIWLLPLGAVAALAAWGLSVLAGKLSLPDQLLLLPMALGFLLLEVYLWRNPHGIRLVWQVALGMIAVYQIFSLYYEAAYKLHQRDGITPAALWFPMVYLMAFNLLSRKQALRFSLTYLALGLLAGAIGLVSSPSLNVSSANTALQFTLSNIAYLSLLYLFAYLRRHYAQMHQMAHTDALTSLTNRRAMQIKLDNELDRARRYNRPFAVLLADLDHFKRVNDTYGHPVGDQVLREASGRLLQHLRESDSLARWGGEEFLILAPETDLQQAHRLAQRLLEAIREAPMSGVHVTLSLGVACYRQGDTIAALLSRADEAMYRAKAAGRNRVVLEEQLEDVIIPAHTTPDTQ
ncbi:sensor domain-containing diguanylate cyclase [Meiothermus hypogaeus]|uniref:GGDEF domain-containing protein n=2 Tax=Meiothermus hypogaeus TaxID=884155 RepID=A0A511QZR5_9DEIN|nr:GGDEF domain-containing protein [Meiothermus hypogaeus]RIH75491.1 Response regulator PleD [Meiothermus hypogaeus]GEM82848.1 GGDEF domain-containing protein [Meiothermus hypogaeus NBRC 106114]